MRKRKSVDKNKIYGKEFWNYLLIGKYLSTSEAERFPWRYEEEKNRRVNNFFDCHISAWKFIEDNEWSSINILIKSQIE